MNDAHISVFLQEAVTALNVRPEGTYLDGTLGRAGHTQAILAKLGENGRLVAVDRDPQAVAAGKERFADDPRVTVVHADFGSLQEALDKEELPSEYDGILFDLGVSSPQLDQADRGFSFMQDGPLDMRMDVSQGETAAQWLATAEEQDIANVIYRLGEEKFSRRIARAIVTARAEGEITTTGQLVNLIEDVIPRREKHKHPATRTFLAIRLHINNELGQLEDVLPQAVRLLNQSGRLVVISFHSLEDRIVKRFIRDLSKGPVVPKHIPVLEKHAAPLVQVGKAVKPSDKEVQENARARSAILRVAERTEVVYA